jgi:cytochrome bd-type quinol oxidase subunit 2
MIGVEILAMEEVVTKTSYNWTAFAICFIIVFVIFSIPGIIVSFNEKEKNYFFAIFFTILGAIFSFILGAAMGIPSEYTTQYKVTISDEVQLNEFNERYEIIEQEGKIYTVRERND